MSDLKELIKYIELLEAEPFTGWTGGNKKGYLTACTSIKKKAEKLLQEQANGANKSIDTALHKHIVTNSALKITPIDPTPSPQIQQFLDDMQKAKEELENSVMKYLAIPAKYFK